MFVLKSFETQLNRLWVKGKTEGLVSARQAKEVMGVSDNMRADGTGPTNRPSTLPHYKPGMAYFYPSMKIHKLQKSQLIPGVEPPIRLITALHDGISKRSDVFIAENYLGALEKDFCGDLLTDSTDALRWLDAMDETLTTEVKQQLSCFTFDFKALYDSLNQELVIEALKEAAKECRPDWSSTFVAWLVELVELSLESSVGVFEDSWYKQKEGIPTGGSLCVQLANITVYSILRKTLYNNQELMANVTSAKRYVDDGAGLIKGSPEDFTLWIEKVNKNLDPYGLHIDESCICPLNSFIPFLDIQFCFDDSGSLQTDLFVKPTDSRAYLNFGSAHPKHTFSGIVYSCCFRLRRIINNQERLETRLQELKACFKNAGYPDSLINDSIRKALGSERSLNRKVKAPENLCATPSIRVVSTFGSDSDIVNSVRKFESSLTRTRSFSESDIPDTLPSLYPRSSTPTHNNLSVTNRSTRNSRSLSPSISLSRISTPSAQRNSTPQPTRSKPTTSRIFQFVKKTGASIKSRVVNVKNIALGNRFGRTKPCKSKNCKCCKLISEKESYNFNNNTIKPAGGSCKSYNVIYLFVCKHCNKHYVGRSTRALRTRVGEHRRNFYRMCDRSDFSYDKESDEFTLGHHLFHDHKLNIKSDFDNSYTVSILDISSPKVLDVKEHKFIHLLNSLTPLGLNLSNPFAMPLLYR